MDKLDLTKTDRAYYGAGASPSQENFGPVPYLRITGTGAPGSPNYTEALEALFGLAWTLKFQTKALGRDFSVAKLEGQWWWPDDFQGLAATEVPRELWHWNLLIRQPDFVTVEDIVSARAKVRAKDVHPLRLDDVEFLSIDEGPCVQILHTGPYATEPTTLAAVHEFCGHHGWTPSGLHHEIYLSDPRKGDPAKAKTILRIPVRPTLTL